jgi:hypothetical protein
MWAKDAITEDIARMEAEGYVIVPYREHRVNPLLWLSGIVLFYAAMWVVTITYDPAWWLLLAVFGGTLGAMTLWGLRFTRN